MKNILIILNSANTITRENYKKLKKILLFEILEQNVLDNVTLLDYIMIKDFESEYDRRDFVQKVFKCEQVSDEAKLKIYLQILGLGIKSCFINPNRDFDEDFRTVAYLKPGNHFNKEVFKNSKELALLFSKFAPFLANKSQKGVGAKRKTIAKNILLHGMIREDYMKLIDNNSDKKGIEEIIRYLVKSENYGTILKLFNDRIFEVNEENYGLIVNSFMDEYKYGYKGLETRYTEGQVQTFFKQLEDVLNVRLDEAKNKTK